jgi:phosphatidylglycerol:prolipoprotein diacylglycerol transferase
MLIHPTIDPVALQIGPLQIHWYGIMYLFGFGIAWLLGLWRAQHSGGAWTRDMVGDLIFYSMVGVIIGGRVGYMLFYALSGFLSHPVEIFKVWQGGMSFHGGLLGVAIAMWLYARHIHKSFIEVADFTAPLVPLALAAGRIGNFINGELWGKVTDVPWGIIFPQIDQQLRHPSQLYEFMGEGVLLFIILWFFSAKERPRMAVSGLFSLCYGVFRFFLECYREPDPQYGYLAWDWLTMGQVLSLPMIALGIIMLFVAYRGYKVPSSV